MANASGDPINIINLEAGTYTLTEVDNNPSVVIGPSGVPSITSNITINGTGAGTTIIERANSAPPFRIFHIAETGILTLNGLTIRGGFLEGAEHFGGGILNNGGILQITNSIVSGNSAMAAGGGIANGRNVSGGTLMGHLTIPWPFDEMQGTLDG
jgi:hypothetical protein